MIPIELVEDYLIDQDDGIKKLLTWFLNLVMQLEAIQQADAEPYQRIDSRKAHRNGYKERSLKTRVGDIRLRNLNFVKSRSRPEYLTDIRVWRRL